jgi:hypothetical protein
MKTLLVLLFTIGLNAADIPQKLDVGSYSIDVKLDKDCKVEIYKQTGRVRILYDETTVSTKTGYSIEVMKLIIPLPKEDTSIDKFLDKVVMGDFLGFHNAVFGRRISFAPSAIIKSKSKFGYTRHYVDRGAENTVGSRIFAQTSAIIKAYDRSSLAIYLVCGLEINSDRRISPTWLGLVTNIVEGMEENKPTQQNTNKALEPPPAPETPAA